jgi:polyhydroxyalkanoate synthesis regulator phasin
MEKLQKEMGKIGEMTPEEAGRKVGEFLKGLEKGSGKTKQ